MILGLSAGFHDAGATVIDKKGNILFAGHAERYSGIKNDAYLNKKLIDDASLSSMRLPQRVQGGATMKGFRIFVKVKNI